MGDVKSQANHSLVPSQDLPASFCQENLPEYPQEVACSEGVDIEAWNSLLENWVGTVAELVLATRTLCVV